MTKQLIGIGAAPNDGTGDNLRTAFGKANTNFNELYGMSQLAMSGRTATIMGFGDSFAGTTETGGGFLAVAIRWARAFWAPGLDVRMVPGYAVGGTLSTDLPNQYANYIAGGVVPDIAVISTFQNDSGTLDPNFVARAALYKTFVDNLLSSGVRLVIVTSCAPPGSSVKERMNMTLKKMVEDTPGTAYCDLYAETINPAYISGGTTLDAWRSSPDNIIRWTVDGTHPSAEACKAWGRALAEILSPICRRVTPIVSNNDLFDRSSATLKHANAIRAGNMNGTSGRLNGVDNSGVAGFAANGDSRWNITTTNGVVCTPSIITGNDGIRRQRMVVSGTVAGSPYGTLALTYSPGYLPLPNSAPYYGQSVIDLDTVVGLCGIQASSICESFEPSGTDPQYELRPFVGRLFSRVWSTAAADGNAGDRTVKFNFRNGATISGTIDVGQCGQWITTPYPNG